MVSYNAHAHVLHNGRLVQSDVPRPSEGTIAARIIAAHNKGDAENLRIKFDALASHDITYVNIIQSARLGGLESFPVPYVLTNCHNSLCAVGGTINEDDHRFGLSAAIRYGGEFVPAHLAVIHQYMRERYAAPGRMILASDSHTRYGPLGTVAVGEGGPELAKQLLGKTYDLRHPDVVAVHLSGTPQNGVGPQDVALALISEVFEKGLVKNKILEFIGDGIAALPMDFRFGIDVMTTETTCLSSVWQTDETVRRWLTIHGRGGDYVCLQPDDGATYNAAIFIDLSKILPMIALPFHPSNALPISDFLRDADVHLDAVEESAVRLLGLNERPTLRRSMLRDGGCYVSQGVIAGCSGGLYDNLRAAADILDGSGTGCSDFALSAYPASQPMMLRLIEDGTLARLARAGATIRTAFCGPCFGAGDVPSNNGFSIRHTTRNFPNREGSRPADGQAAFVALMDARSIAETARNGGRLTAATLPLKSYEYYYDETPYKQRVYSGFGNPQPQNELVYAPNITDFPKLFPLNRHLVLKLASVIFDDVTTTDELIPSGETSSYRSNPQRLAEFTLSRKDPNYVNRAKLVRDLEYQRRENANSAELVELLNGFDPVETSIGSAIFAKKPGDGSAREQAASCQRVLGGAANLAHSYATKRYRSNVVNWGMLPFVTDTNDFAVGDILYFADIKDALLRGDSAFTATLRRGNDTRSVSITLPDLTTEERDIIISGCLMNYYAG